MSTNIEYVSANGSNVFIVSNTITGSVAVAVDYTNILSNIADAMITISNDIGIIRTLGNTGGNGFMTITPYGWIGSTSLYQLYVEQGYALSNTYVTDAATQEAALQKLELLAQTMKDNLNENL